MINAAVRNMQRQASPSTGGGSISGFTQDQHLSGSVLSRAALRQLQRDSGNSASNSDNKQSGELPDGKPARQPISALSASTENLGEIGKAALSTRLNGVNPDASQSSDTPLEHITEQFQQRFIDQASDKSAFHALMQKSFGQSYDVSQAEAIRLQALDNDFSWMPEIQLVAGSALADVSGQQSEGAGLGAFSRSTNTIYLSRDLLTENLTLAEKILTEEIGHGLDAQLNTTDAAGDEGEIFARLTHNEEISIEELTAIRAENDAGTVLIDGKDIEVEYGWNPLKKLYKSAKKRVKRVGRSIKKGVKKLGNTLKKGFTKLMNSKVMGMVLQVARFVPIPIVQGIAHIVNFAKAGYSVYQGIKHRSLGAVVGGIAGAAGAVAKFGEFTGSAGSWVSKAANVAEKAGQASMAYRVLAEKDIGAALQYLSGHVGAEEPLADLLDGLSKANAVYQAKQSGDFIGVISAGSLLLQDFTDARGDELLNRIADNAETFGLFKEAYETGDYVEALSILSTGISAIEGPDSRTVQQLETVQRVVGNVQTVKTLMDQGDYAEAATQLLETAGMAASDSKTRTVLAEASKTINLVDQAFKAGKAGRYDKAVDYAAIALQRPLDNKTREQVIQLLEQVKYLEKRVDTAREFFSQ